MANAREKRTKRCADATVRAAQAGSDRPSLNMPEGLSLWRPKAQAYTIDLVPYEVTKGIKKFASMNFAKPGDLFYERTYFAHGGVGVNNEMVVCPAKTFDKKCPICEHKAKIQQDPKISDEAKKALAPKQRQLFLVYVHEEKEKGLQLWEVANWNFGRQLDQKINNSEEDRKKELRTFYDPSAGYSLRIIGVEESAGESRKYTKFGVDEWKARKKGLDSKIADHEINLENVPVLLEYADLKKKFYVADDEDENEEKDEADDDADTDDDDSDDDDDESEDEEIVKGSIVTFVYKKKTRTGEVIKIDKKTGLYHVDCDDRDNPYHMKEDELSLADSSDDDNDDSDEDEEEDEKPRRGKKKPKDDDDDSDNDESEEDDEDSDDDDDDSDEDEEKPRRGRGKKPDKKPGRKKKDEDDDDDDSEDEDEPLEDDDDDSEDDDSDDNDDSDEDEEEDEKPRRGKKKPTRRGKK